MPRHVRNFWIESHADGSAARRAVGPRAKDGGARATINQRACGEVSLAFDVLCREHCGALETEVATPISEFPGIVATSRRDSGESFTQFHFRGGFASVLAESLHIAAETWRAASKEEARRGRAEEAQSLADRAAHCERILDGYFPEVLKRW